MRSVDFASIDSYTFVDSSNDLALLVSDARGTRGDGRERAYFFCLLKMLWYRLVFPTSTNGCLRHRVKNLVS